MASALVLCACGSLGDPDSDGQRITVDAPHTRGALTSNDHAAPDGGFNADHFTVLLDPGTYYVAMCRCTTNATGDMDPKLEVGPRGSMLAGDDESGGNHGALVGLSVTTPQTLYDIYAEDGREPVPADGMGRHYVVFVNSGPPPSTPVCPPFPDPSFNCF